MAILAGGILTPASQGMAGDAGCISSGNMPIRQQPVLADWMGSTAAGTIGTQHDWKT